jgi:hypothetical protein
MVRTPGLPGGWLVDGFAPGRDDVGVDRPGNGGPAELVITRHDDSLQGKPLAVYQTIDARPWRGRTIQFSSYTRVYLEPDVMRRTGGARVTELHMECGGEQAGRTVSVDLAWHTRSWVEHNIPIEVPDDATYCRFGMATTVRAEMRLSRVHLKDYRAEREALLARRWPEWKMPAGGQSLFPAGVAKQAAAIAPPNLEFNQ